MSKKSFIKGTIILIIAGMLVRLLGFFYRIYLSNLIGAEGMGLFQLISPVYSLVILTLTSGISIAVSKMTAEQQAKRQYDKMRRTTLCALLIVVTVGTAISILMYLKLDFIVQVILKDERTRLALAWLIPCIPIIAASSAIKGYFYGIQQVTPTAISQLVEQIVKIVIVTAMAGYFVNISLSYACALAVIGMAGGEVANLIFVIIAYYISIKKSNIKKLSSKKGILYSMLVIALPVSANRFIISIMGTVEVILIPQRLLAGGLDYQLSMQEFGRLSGMAIPLIFFPSFITSSLATTLVAAISESISVKNFKMANYRISKSIQLTSAMGFLFTTIFLTYPHEIGNLIYKRERIGDMLYLLAFTCVFIYLQQTLLGILNGLGRQGVLLRNSIVGSVIRISFVYFVMPQYGIKAYVWSIIISSGIVCAMNIYTVVRLTGMSISIGEWFLKPAAVCIAVALGGRYFYHFYRLLHITHSVNVILSVSTVAIVTLLLLFSFGVLDKDDIMRNLSQKSG